MTSSPSENDIIEHVVLFNVNEDDQTKVNEWVNALNSLNSLDSVIYLTAGPILRTRSSPLKFTHMLHARYRTASDLLSYSLHPDHVSVVENLGRPICDDLMAVDWSATLDGEGDHVLVPRPGSALRVSFLQVEGEDVKEDFFEGVRKIKDAMGPYEQISYGENISDRGKGYSVATLVVFPDLNELDSSEEYEDHMRSLVDKVKGNSDDDGIIVLDYVVPRFNIVNSASE